MSSMFLDGFIAITCQEFMYFCFAGSEASRMVFPVLNFTRHQLGFCGAPLRHASIDTGIHYNVDVYLLRSVGLLGL